MADAWRVPFARCLQTTCGVPHYEVRFHVHGVARSLAWDGDAGGGGDPAVLPRFLRRLSLETEPWQVKQAEEAVGHYDASGRSPRPLRTPVMPRAKPKPISAARSGSAT